MNRIALFEKLGVGSHRETLVGFRRDGLTYPFVCANWNGGLHHNYWGYIPHRSVGARFDGHSDIDRSREDVLEVSLPLFIRRSSNTNEVRIRLAVCFPLICRELEAPRTRIAGDQFVETRLIDWGDSLS